MKYSFIIVFKIKAIEMERDKMIDNVCDYYQEKIDHAQAHYGNAFEMGDRVAKKRSEIRQFVSSDNIVKIIRERKKMFSEVDELLSTEKDPLEIRDNQCLVTLGKHQPTCQLARIPPSPSLRDSHILTVRI